MKWHGFQKNMTFELHFEGCFIICQASRAAKVGGARKGNFRQEKKVFIGEGSEPLGEGRRLMRGKIKDTDSYLLVEELVYLYYRCLEIT